MTVKLDNRQSRQRAALDQLSNSTNLRLDNILNLINDELTMPLRMRATSTPNQVLNIDPITVQTSDSAEGTLRTRTIQPINNLLPTFPATIITFPTSSGGSITTSGTFTGGPYTLTVSSGNWIKVMISLNSAGLIALTFGTQGASEAAATMPATFPGSFSIGYVSMQNIGGTIQTVTNARIYQFTGSIGPGTNIPLTDSHILVGNASNVGTDVAVTGDIAISNTGVTSIASNVIVDADINASAAISGSKIQEATGSVAGVVSTGTQTFAGTKTFTGTVNITDSNLSLNDSGDSSKKILFNAGGTTATTTTITAAQTASRVLTLPDVTDTLVSRTSTDTGANRLTNKDVSDTTFAVVDNADTSKKILFDAGGTTATTTTITAAQTANRVLTLPNVTGTLATTAAATPTVAGLVTSYAPVIQSASYTQAGAGAKTITDTDGLRYLFFAPGNGVTVQVNLPAASANSGREIVIKKSDTSTGYYILNPTGGNTVDGQSALYGIQDYAETRIVSNGTNWFTISPPSFFQMGYVRVTTCAANGTNSSNRIPHFTVHTDADTPTTDITYTSDAAAGDSFTINSDGIYAISFSIGLTGADLFGISRNGGVTTTVGNLTVLQRLCISNTNAADVPGTVATTLQLASGDVIRAHTSGNGPTTNASYTPMAQFTICRIW